MIVNFENLWSLDNSLILGKETLITPELIIQSISHLNSLLGTFFKTQLQNLIDFRSIFAEI